MQAPPTFAGPPHVGRPPPRLVRPLPYPTLPIILPYVPERPEIEFLQRKKHRRAPREYVPTPSTSILTRPGGGTSVFPHRSVIGPSALDFHDVPPRMFPADIFNLFVRYLSKTVSFWYVLVRTNLRSQGPQPYHGVFLTSRLYIIRRGCIRATTPDTIYTTYCITTFLLITIICSRSHKNPCTLSSVSTLVGTTGTNTETSANFM